MLVKELYLDAITFEESTLAHYLYHLLTERKISLDDDITHLDLVQANHQKVAAMIEMNLLDIRKIGIYSLKRKAKDFVFIFAKSEQEAIQFFTKTFQQAPLNCHENSLDYEIAHGNEMISFRDMRAEFNRFPAIAGYFVKGS